MRPPGSRSLSRTSKGWDRTASPIHDGATTSVSVPRGGLTGQLVQGAAVGTARLAQLLDRQVHARMRVPQFLRGQRAMQRKVLRRDLDELAVKLGLRHFRFAPA